MSLSFSLECRRTERWRCRISNVASHEAPVIDPTTFCDCAPKPDSERYLRIMVFWSTSKGRSLVRFKTLGSRPGALHDLPQGRTGLRKLRRLHSRPFELCRLHHAC